MNQRWHSITRFYIFSKDDPLKFNYWRKRLREVREELRYSMYSYNVLHSPNDTCDGTVTIYQKTILLTTKTWKTSVALFRAAALAKLKEKCPTLFKMGWFKVVVAVF